VAATTSSFDANFCPASDPFKFGNKKKSHGTKYGEYGGGGVVRSPIRPIWTWRGRKCEPVRCHNGRALFSSPNGAVFSAIRRRIGPITRHSTALLPFCPSPGSRCRSHPVNLKKRWPSPFRPMEQTSPSSEQVRRVKSTVSGLWCVPMDPCFVDGHESTQELLRIALKQRLTVAFVVRSEQTRHPSRRELSHAQNFMQDMTHAVF